MLCTYMPCMQYSVACTYMRTEAGGRGRVVVVLMAIKQHQHSTCTATASNQWRLYKPESWFIFMRFYALCPAPTT